MGKVSKISALPTTFSEEVFTTICHRLAEGETLSAICRDEDMPHRSNVHMWLIKDEELHDRYMRAREIQAEVYVDQIMDIADDSRNDYMLVKNADGSEREVVDHENIQRARLRIDARKWVAGKAKPKKYGESKHLDVEQGVTIKVRHTFPEPNGPEVIEAEAIDVTEEENEG